MQIKQRRWFYVSIMIFIVAIFAMQACKKGDPKPPEGAVAMVNGEILTQEEFDSELSMMQKQFASMGQSENDEQLAKIKSNILENLIARKVLSQESKKKGVEADEAAIEERLAGIKQRFAQQEGSFEKMLEEMHLTEAGLKDQLRSGMVIQELINQEVVNHIEVSDQESRAYSDENPQLFKQPEKVQASHILIKVEPEGDEAKKAEALEKIKKVQNELKKGGDFAELAKQHSQCPSSAKGGDLGFFARGQMVKPFENAAFSLKKGERSDIVETRFGYHLIRSGDRTPETTNAYADVKDRLAEYLKRMKADTEAQKYVEGLKEAATIERFLPEDNTEENAE